MSNAPEEHNMHIKYGTTFRNTYVSLKQLEKYANSLYFQINQNIIYNDFCKMSFPQHFTETWDINSYSVCTQFRSDRW